MFSEKQGNVLHGILLIVLFSFSAFYIAEFQFIKSITQPPHRRYHIGYALRQQPA